MSFAEVALRIGVAFVSWMMIYMHLLMLLVVQVAQCPGGDASPWKVTMVTGVLALGAAFAALYGHGVKGVGQVFRYFALPLTILVPWATWVAAPYLSATTFGALEVCVVRLGLDPGSAPPIWQQNWAPLQLLVLAVIAVNGWRAWRSGNQAHAHISKA